MGLKDTLGFGKHSTFAAEIKIHELLQVPLRDAKFRLKWHFKDATTHGVAVTQFAESLVNRSDESHHLSSHLAEAGRRLLQPVNSLVDTALGGEHHHQKLEASRSQSPSDPSRAGVSSSTSAANLNDAARTPNVLSPVMSPHLDSITPNPNKTPMPQSIQFSSPFSRTPTQVPDDPNMLSRPTRSRTSDGQNSSLVSSAPMGQDEGRLSQRRGGGDLAQVPLEANSHHRLEPKGETSFVPLRSHTATFERTIVCPVQISARSNPPSHRYLLQPSAFKISIKQDGIDHTGHHQREEKIGEVNLDLSQFVGKEVKPRRFLLGNCKTNSILRITVKMKYLEGESRYVAPSLVNGRMSSLSNSKSNNASARSTPTNRSSASLVSSPRNKLPSNLNPGSNTSTQMSRTASATSSIHSSATSLNDHSRTSSHNDSLNRLTEENLSNRRRAAENKVVGPNGRRKAWHPPTSFSHFFADGTAGEDGSQPGERSATDIIESIFNRQPETPASGKAAWYTHIGANDKAHHTPRPNYTESVKATKENDKIEADKSNQAKKAAWSIRSFKRSKNKPPPPVPQRQSSLDAPSVAPSVAHSTSTASSMPRSEAAVTDQPAGSGSVPIPSGQQAQERPFNLERAGVSFGSNASTQRAGSPPRSPRQLSASSSTTSLRRAIRPSSGRAASYGSSVSMSHPLASSQSSTTSSRALSVRFDHEGPLTDSPPSIRFRRSTDTFSNADDDDASSSSSLSVRGLGLSDSTLANAANGFTTPRSSVELTRVRSHSFNSIVTPPSPERTPMRQRTTTSDSWRGS
ncbi:uncharacterized protein JCM15063_003912 [Sporobolomyces koalae]|uniref:uncharacterized protein n=1 Tax=Sporobolomyces koalae TaxID=500713 RepID=UPI0031817BCB